MRRGQPEPLERLEAGLETPHGMSILVVLRESQSEPVLTRQEDQATQLPPGQLMKMLQESFRRGSGIIGRTKRKRFSEEIEQARSAHRLAESGDLNES